MSGNLQHFIFDALRRMRTIRREHCLSPQAQALLYLLIELANEQYWPESFKCSNGELMGQLSSSEKSLIRYRGELINADIIDYESGKSKKESGIYRINYCKFYNQSDSQSDSQPGLNGSDSNKTKTYTKNKREVHARNLINGSFKIPDMDEVIDAFKKNGGSSEMAKKFYSSMQATNWKKNGAKVTNFVHLVPSFIENWRKNEQRGTKKTENHDYAAIAAFRKKQEDEAWAAINGNNASTLTRNP
ncbi:MAG TPA: hypothetical protein PKY29_06085 [Ferruginibacter sp.]|nr:hypothetical protein [Ferruginibacter sp.]HRO17700.1 hypothetical protein [Ferruginibacter sp.]HRQ20865.1 hypothetical protein [Ferruginibacter sp.]